MLSSHSHKGCVTLGVGLFLSVPTSLALTACRVWSYSYLSLTHSSPFYCHFALTRALLSSHYSCLSLMISPSHSLSGRSLIGLVPFLFGSLYCHLAHTQGLSRLASFLSLFGQGNLQWTYCIMVFDFALTREALAYLLLLYYHLSRSQSVDLLVLFLSLFGSLYCHLTRSQGLSRLALFLSLFGQGTLQWTYCM